MRVKELIEQLQKCDPELPVFFYDVIEECDGMVLYADQLEGRFPVRGDSAIDMYYDRHPEDMDKDFVVLHNHVYAHREAEKYGK